MDAEKLITSNHFAKVEKLIGKNFHLDPDTQRIKRNAVTPDWNTPWIVYFTKDNGMNCLKWHTVMFPCFNVIPKECMECYKVVVRPKTIVDLFGLKEIMDTLDPKIQRKCGIEALRDYVEAPYGGYFYNKGMEAGLDMLDIVRTMLDGKIEFEAYLKRACTEYELKFGRSDKWKLDPREEEYSNWIDKHFHKNCWINPVLPDYGRQNVMARWMDFAAFIGDHSYLKLTNGQYLNEQPIKYERG